MPRCYMSLHDTFGLTTLDPAWKALLGAPIFTEFVTRSLIRGYADKGMFPHDGCDIHAGVGGEWRPLDSDIVAFRSAPAEGNRLRSLVAGNDRSQIWHYILPPLATVTLRKVLEAGEWQAYGVKPGRRLYVVSVAY